ncbi:MAG TPA: hypothetical protein VFG35_17430 [Actinoplanes sp.]|nr:hypothetical protein [Actinoplanes sp.]
MATVTTLLRDLPLNRVVRLSGVSAEDVAAELGRSDGLPACVLVGPRGSGSVAAFVSEVLDTLDAIARQLLPGWLPEADGLDGPQGASVAAIRAVAVEHARATGQSSAFLADLAAEWLADRTAPTTRRCSAARSGLISGGRPNASWWSWTAWSIVGRINTTPTGSATSGCNWMATPSSGSPTRACDTTCKRWSHKLTYSFEIAGMT